MTIITKTQDTIYPSIFKGATFKDDGFKSNYLGVYYHESKYVDLYFVEYQNGSINAVFQMGEEEREYGSGSTFMYHNQVSKVSSPYSEIYKRAVKEGLLVEKTRIVGISDIKLDADYAEYGKTEYCKNKPDAIAFYDQLSTIDDEDLIEKMEQEFEVSVKNYDEDYCREHGDIPKNPAHAHYAEFNSIEEAREMCPRGKGYFVVVKAVDDHHLDAILLKENLNHKLRLVQKEVENEDKGLSL